MTRVKTPKTIITFSSTSDALAMEAAAASHGIPGRMIPVPSSIDAGCGMAWCVEPDDCDAAESWIHSLDLACEGRYEALLY